MAPQGWMDSSSARALWRYFICQLPHRMSARRAHPGHAWSPRGDDYTLAEDAARFEEFEVGVAARLGVAPRTVSTLSGVDLFPPPPHVVAVVRPPPRYWYPRV